MEITGKLNKKLPLESGTAKSGNPWQKMTFVLAKKGTKTPQEIALDTLNAELIQFINDTSAGTVLKVQFDVTSREFNGKYYTNATAWSAEVVKDEGMEVQSHKGVQQMAQMHNQQYQRANTLITDDEDDNLPF